MRTARFEQNYSDTARHEEAVHQDLMNRTLTKKQIAVIQLEQSLALLQRDDPEYARTPLRFRLLTTAAAASSLVRVS